MKEREVRILNRLEQIPIVAGMLSRFGSELGLTPTVVHDLQVAVDEALNNIISYGYEANAESEIMVRIERQPDEVIVVIEDHGGAFDPLENPAPDLSGSLQTRKVGGVGIHFMRSLMDKVSYERVGTANRLRLIKKTAV